MKKRFSFLIVCLVFCIFCISASAFANGVNVYPGYVVKFSSDTVKTQNTKSLFKANNYKINKSFKNYSLVMPETTISNGRNLRLSLNNDVNTITTYDVNDDTCLKLKELGAVECSPNFMFKISSFTPNDQYYSAQWALKEQGVNIGDAWAKTKGNKSVVVAVVDTGVDYNHPDLIDNMWVNTREIPGNGIDDDDNGIVDDIYGANFIDDSGNPYDDNGHGTHVAGIIGAKGNNSIGITGVNLDTSIIALKFLDRSGRGSLYNAIKAYEYLLELKNRGINIKVVNNSWGGGSYTQSLYDVMNKLAKLGVVLTCAAGNESSNNDSYDSFPANFDIDNLISVASTDEDENISQFSNIGSNTVDIAAPGRHILSTYPNNQYASMSGTSMATPYVTGAMALLLGYDKSLNASDAINRLYSTGRDAETLVGTIRTERIVDVKRLIENSTTPLPEMPTCSYNENNINFDDSNPAKNTNILLQADEYSMLVADLPFEFPFYGENYSTINVSPNGVVYFGYKPTSWDYQNKLQAPSNSIAAFHTDLIATSNPYGVRLYTSREKAVIYWEAKAYGLRDLEGNYGDVYVKLVLYPDGLIEDYVSFYDMDTIDYVSRRYTIGVSERGGGKTTYAYNDLSKLNNNLAIRFTPICNAVQSLELNNVDLYRVNNANKKFNKLKRSKRYQMIFDGSGNGTIQARVGFEFGYCPELLNIELKNGKAVKNGNLAIPVNYAKKLKIDVPKYNLRKARSITQRRNNNNKVYNSKKSKRHLKLRCKRLLSLLK